MTTVALVQELLHRQQGFQRHYAGSVDGCGLKLEAEVRRAYYALLRRLMEAVRDQVEDTQQPRSGCMCYVTCKINKCLENFDESPHHGVDFSWEKC